MGTGSENTELLSSMWMINKSIKLMDTILDRSIDQLKIGRNKYSRESE